MKSIDKINVFRRKLTKFLSSLFVTNEVEYTEDFVKNINIKRIMIIRPNHRLGNQLLLTPLVEEVSLIFPNCEIDLFLKGTLGNEIFSNFDNVINIIELPKKHFKYPFKYISSWLKLKRKKYDLVINAIGNSSSGKLATKISNSKLKFYGVKSLSPKSSGYKHIAKLPIYNLRAFLLNIGFNVAKTKVPPLNIKLSDTEIIEGNKIILKIVKNNRQTISLFTYATNDKCYSKEWWDEFYQMLLIKFPNYNIIEILPIENISNLSIDIPKFYSKNIREIASVIANTTFFIGADSGMMHLASSSQATTIGLFSVTELNTYTPYDNYSIAVNTNIINKKGIIRLIDNIIINKIEY